MKKKARKRQRVGLSMKAESELKHQLLSGVCSAAWLDSMFKSIRREVNGSEIGMRVFDPSVYPPPADTTPMVVCECCGVPTPPHCVGSSGRCLDCHVNRAPQKRSLAFGPSSWAQTMKAIRQLNHKVELSLARRW